jgi:hypothetical protein
MDSFNHNVRYQFIRGEEDWHLSCGWDLSDIYREIESLIEDGIPGSAIKVVCRDYDRVGWQRYHRITIDLSADNEVRALQQRLYDAWLEQKRQDDARYIAMRDAALKNQQEQNIDWSTFEF